MEECNYQKAHARSMPEETKKTLWNVIDCLPEGAVETCCFQWSFGQFAGTAAIVSLYGNRVSIVLQMFITKRNREHCEVVAISEGPGLESAIQNFVLQTKESLSL